MIFEARFASALRSGFFAVDPSQKLAFNVGGPGLSIRWYRWLVAQKAPKDVSNDASQDLGRSILAFGINAQAKLFGGSRIAESGR